MRYIFFNIAHKLHSEMEQYLQRLQNKVLRSIGNFPRRTPTHDLHVALKIPYVYDFVTKVRKQQSAIIQSHAKYKC
jgi:hypothetical protein